MKKIFLLVSLLSFLFLPLFSAFAQEASPAQEEVLEGRVMGSLEEDVITEEGKQFLYQKLKIEITKGSLEGREIIVEVGNIPLVGQPKYQPEDEVLLNYGRDFEGNEIFYITDFIRRRPLIWLFLLFVVLAILVGGWWGLSSLLGLGISFLVIFIFILPQIYRGQDPVLIAVFGSLIIIPFSFYFSHGLNKKTTIAILGTLIALGITGLLARFFVDWSRLTGYASEEAGFLQVARPGVVNIRGLILAGIIIGVLGVLDDITVSQAAIVQQLKEANPRLKAKEIFLRAMKVGRDHIASMVNTLVLVYAGAALPLLLLFIDNPHPFAEVINYELIAEEIVRTLVGSIGLMAAVPLTTGLAACFMLKK